MIFKFGGLPVWKLMRPSLRIGSFPAAFPGLRPAFFGVRLPMAYTVFKAFSPHGLLIQSAKTAESGPLSSSICFSWEKASALPRCRQRYKIRQSCGRFQKGRSLGPKTGFTPCSAFPGPHLLAREPKPLAGRTPGHLTQVRKLAKTTAKTLSAHESPPDKPT